MEKDRGLSLLRQAYVEGYLDPAKADYRDHKWHANLRWTLDWLERKNRIEMRKLHYTLHCAMLNYLAGDRAVETHWDQALELHTKIGNDLLPWEKTQYEQLTRAAVRSLTDLWISIFGNPSDPDVKERIEKTAAELRGRARANMDKQNNPGFINAFGTGR